MSVRHFDHVLLTVYSSSVNRFVDRKCVRPIDVAADIEVARAAVPGWRGDSAAGDSSTKIRLRRLPWLRPLTGLQIVVVVTLRQWVGPSRWLEDRVEHQTTCGVVRRYGVYLRAFIHLNCIERATYRVCQRSVSEAIR